MKIVHLCLSCFYVDGYAYQENCLVFEHVRAGHDVHVISSTESYDRGGQLTYLPPSSYAGSDGAPVIRLKYRLNLIPSLARKIRAYEGLAGILEEIKPEIIMFHGLCAWDILTVAAYVRRNPEVNFFIDCHEDFNNSARSWASRALLHKLVYRPIFRRCIDQIREVLCVTVESLEFAVEFYGSPRAKTRLYPLGCVIESTESVAERRTSFRRKHGLANNNIVVVQTGKFNSSKLLESALSAFCSIPSAELRFVIAGKMTEDVKETCQPLIESDSRIIDLGWQSADELRTVLSGADCFLQPFGQTVTSQMAAGFGCVILAQDLPSHRWLVGNRGFLFKDASELTNVFMWVLENSVRLEDLKFATSQFAVANLSYRQLALQILS